MSSFLDRMFKNMEKEFIFKGETLTYNKLKEELHRDNVLKVYTDTSRFERKLMKSPEGQMFLYEYHEEMGFPDDRITELFVLVSSEEDADKLNQDHFIASGRPHIYVGEACAVSVRG
ncbi:hypothetical protein BCB4_0140 [Bacillus phage B4]|uniref:Uncharacterized protein n=2 Tax=Bequatrovirus B4 TaxID=1918005 RepID=J9PRG9_9CAUD|nr:hypothetical protein BCB4_0140 [Bacillus phage B4]YP_009783731.1 hypothetical protein QLX26_gp135 [Bacillus phage B5S]MEB9013994.1 hypothetical protein [Bacillus cereus]AEW47369.1 hypothetical protein B5S_0135 [Bacillus phage B5S]AEZ65933.1 hypothetical protein BCB4_0140 [Bacillus phage B4]MEB9190659.1 hypothetical protein [Bacillus cereus]